MNNLNKYITAILKYKKILLIILSVLIFYFLFIIIFKEKQISIIPETYIVSEENSQSSETCTIIVKVSSEDKPKECIPHFTKSNGVWIDGNNIKTVADVNGDSKKDVIYFLDNRVEVKLSNGTKFGASQVWSNNYTKNTGWKDQDKTPRTLADVNGDGLEDIVGFGDNGTYVSLSDGTKFSEPKIWITNYAIKAGGWESQIKYPRLLADVNGDCLEDIVGFGNQATYVSLSDGTKFSEPKVWINNFAVRAGGWKSQNDYPRALADLNKDGKADIVGFGNKATYVSLSTGSNFSEPKVWNDNYVRTTDWKTQKEYPRFLGDLNNNNMGDVLGFRDITYFSLNSGDKFGNLIKSVENYTIKKGNWENEEKYPRNVADVNGDGLEDIVGFGNKYIFVSINLGNNKFDEPKAWSNI